MLFLRQEMNTDTCTHSETKVKYVLSQMKATKTKPSHSLKQADCEPKLVIKFGDSGLNVLKTY